MFLGKKSMFGFSVFMDMGLKSEIFGKQHKLCVAILIFLTSLVSIKWQSSSLIYYVLISVNIRTSSF